MASDIKPVSPVRAPDAARAGSVSLMVPIPNPALAQPTAVKLRNVPIDAERVVWAYSPGPAAYTFSFEVWESVHAALSRMGGGPHTLTMRCPGLGNVDELVVKGVYLLDFRPGDERAVSWRIGDRRWWLDYAKFTGRFNLRRRINDVVGLDPADAFGYNVERYRPYSAAVAWDKNGKQVKGPQTALGLVRRILDVCDPTGVDGATFAKVEDNGVPVESRQYLEDRPSVALTELLRLAEVNFFVTLDSKYLFYNLNEDLFSTRAIKETGWVRGRFMQQKNYRTRPTTINCSFLQEQEVEAVTEDAHPNPPVDVYTSGGSANLYEKLADAAGLKIVQLAGTRDVARQADDQAAPPQAPGNIFDQALAFIKGGPAPAPAAPQAAGVLVPNAKEAAAAQAAFLQAIGRGANANQQVPDLKEPMLLENVLQVPRTINVTVTDNNGQQVSFEFTRGEFVRVDVAMAAWRILDAQSGVAPLIPLTEDNLRKYWFGNVIGRMYGFNIAYPTWVDPVRMERIGVLRSSYRRVYRVAKPYLDMIHDMKAERVTIVDPITRTLALPFVSTQYCEVPNLRPATRAHPIARVAAENKDDYTNGVQSPFTFTVRPEMGIVVVESIPDLTQTNLIRERLLGQVDNIPRYDLNPDGSIIWQRAQLNASFKMKVILTVQWGAPNDKNVLYTVKKDVASQGGRGGLMEIFSQIDSARIDVDGVVVNAGLLERAAQFEVNQIMFSHRDVGIGWAHFKGFRKHLHPAGGCRSVQFICENGFPYTMYDATEPYTQRPSAAAMDAATRNFALRITEAG